MSMEQVVNLAKQRGFVFPGSDIYGGLSKYLGLWPTWYRIKEQYQKSLVAKIHSRIAV